MKRILKFLEMSWNILVNSELIFSLKLIVILKIIIVQYFRQINQLKQIIINNEKLLLN